MKVEVVSPSGIIFDGDAESVLFPGLAGEFMILQHHAPLIAALKEGEIRIDAGGETKNFHIKSGFVEVNQTIVSVCIEL